MQGIGTVVKVEEVGIAGRLRSVMYHQLPAVAALVENIRGVAVRCLFALVRGHCYLLDDHMYRAKRAAHGHGLHSMNADRPIGKNLLPRHLQGVLANGAHAPGVNADDLFVVGPHLHHEAEIGLSNSLVEGRLGFLGGGKAGGGVFSAHGRVLFGLL